MRGDSVTFGTHHIGRDHPPYVIAEIGSNHNMDYDLVCGLIESCADAGIDAVKFQTFYPDDFISKKITAGDYGLGALFGNDTPWQNVLRDRLILPFAWYESLVRHIRARGMDFITTVHSERSLHFALQFDPVAIKIASMDLTHTPLLAAVARTGLPVVVSIGMGSLAEIEAAVTTLEENGCQEIVLMHCVSEYPADFSKLNLRFIPTLASAFSLPVGFSDHSLGVSSSVAAVALGACVIEKHVTRDRTLPGPDHPFALEPQDVRDLVAQVRQAHDALGANHRHVGDTERRNKMLYRRSVVAGMPMSAGETMSRDRIKFQRPGFGIHPGDVDRVLGLKLNRDVDEGDVLTWDMFLGG